MASYFGSNSMTPIKDTAPPLSLPEYRRYGRQMILPSFGLEGQLRLRQSKVLVVGAGGLGCPAIQYLAAAGVGHITVVDHDVVEMSNLARQILHTDDRIGMPKAESAAIAAQIINPHIHVEPVIEPLSTDNAVSLVSRHDLVLDCTDNVLTRYLISDAAVMCGIEVVSGAAQGLAGQLIVLHKDLTPETYAAGVSRRKTKNTKRGPCYRCLFPKAPRPEDVTDCEDGGVLGGVTGLVGNMQALEAVKLLVGIKDDDDFVHMTLVSPMSYPPFKTVKMSQQGIAAKIPPDLSGEDYMTFCGLQNAGPSVSLHKDITVSDLSQTLRMGSRPPCVDFKPPVLIDVRPPVEYGIVHLPNSKNLPYRDIDANPIKLYDEISSSIVSDDDGVQQIFVVCRRGNDSRLACIALNAVATKRHAKAPVEFVNVSGGLRAWAADVDGSFPVY